MKDITSNEKIKELVRKINEQVEETDPERLKVPLPARIWSFTRELDGLAGALVSAGQTTARDLAHKRMMTPPTK